MQRTYIYIYISSYIYKTKKCGKRERKQEVDYYPSRWQTSFAATFAAAAFPAVLALASVLPALTAALCASVFAVSLRRDRHGNPLAPAGSPSNRHPVIKSTSPCRRALNARPTQQPNRSTNRPARRTSAPFGNQLTELLLSTTRSQHTACRRLKNGGAGNGTLRQRCSWH